ncbi:MAG: protein NO VEIN domain-containing protein, partial [Bryobacteraceae bacterium]
VVCKDAILPRIRVDAPVPPAEDLIRFTRYAKQLLGTELGAGANIWVITKTGGIRRATEVLPPREFHPVQDWETNQQYVAGLNFVSDMYLDGADDEQIIRPWREFFRAAGVKNAPDKGVEEFGMNYAVQWLGTRWTNVRPVENRNLGYDLEADDDTGKGVYIEVKGLSDDGDVNLSPNETRAADTYQDLLYVCVISGIPEHPAMFLLCNPARCGRKERITVPVAVWRSFRWEPDSA